MKPFRTLLCLLLAGMLLAGPVPALAAPLNTGGSASTLAGRTLVLTIFADDPLHSWEGAMDRITRVKSSLSIACDYIEDVCRQHGVEAEFEQVYRFVHFGVPLDADSDELIWACLDELAPDIRAARAPDNLIALVALNTTEFDDMITCTRDWYEGMPSEYEIVYLYYYDSGYVNCPAVYAHELLHTFGAPDLYMAGDSVSEALVRQVARDWPNDIMYTCSDLTRGEYVYGRITNEVGPVTAAFLGLEG